MKKILVIDDDPKICKGLNIRLKFAGYEVRSAEDGVAGLKLALEFKPDLVILDIMMPVGGGFSVAYRLREQAPELPVIFITASKQPQLREMTEKLGAVSFFEKPYEFEELLAAVKKASQSESRGAATPESSPKPESIAQRIATANSPTSVPQPDPRGHPLSLRLQNEIIKPRDNPNPPSRQAMTGPEPEASQRIAKQDSRPTVKKILVVDDDADGTVLQAIKQGLNHADYQMFIAADGESGLNLAMKFNPDLVILDIDMSGGGGRSVIRRLQQHAPALPIILILTGRHTGMRDTTGNVSFLEKPYEACQLLKLVAEALAAAPPQHPKTEFPAPAPLKVEPPAPTTPKNAPDLPLPNLRIATSSSNAPKSQPETVGITGRNKILIVEDDRRIAMALALRLQNAGQEVVQAFDAMSGVEAAITHQPDLILMDISLPGGSGLVVAQRIQSVIPKPTPIIFLTASQQPGLRQKALALGAAGFLEKPYNPEDLLAKIQGALLAAMDKAPGSRTPAPTTPEHAPDLRLANLKMAAPSSYASKSEPELPGITGRNKILIVEDDRRIAMDLTLRLQKAGQEVIQASDAMSGVEAAVKHQADLILVDINLSGGSGLVVAQKIQSVVPKLTPIIFLTDGRLGLRQEALALGAAGFLEKACSSEDLLTTIHNALSLGRGDDPTGNEGFSL
jgi:DNA-binding response OmpR family regulator